MALSRRKLLLSGVPAGAVLAGWGAVSATEPTAPPSATSGGLETLTNIEGLAFVVGSLVVSSGTTMLRSADGARIALAATPAVDAVVSHEISEFEMLLSGEESAAGFRVVHVTPDYPYY